LKLLWHSNAPFVPTGYGAQTALFAPLFAERYDFAISSYYGLEGNAIVWHDIPIFSGMGVDWGNASLPMHASKFIGDDDGYVITLADVWPLDPDAMAPLKMACWCPVDHEPAPPRVRQFFITTGHVPIAMSRFGERMLGLLDPLYVPHGVPTDVFKPTDATVAKRRSFGDGAFVVGIVGANKGHPSRKGFWQSLQAFARFVRRHDDAFLYLHTVLSSAYAMGEEISAMIDALGIPRERVRQADQYALMHAPYSVGTMAEIYNTIDVLLNPSWGEGFGIPVLEAAACGVPAVVTDFTAMPEVAGPAGLLVTGFETYWTAQGALQAYPHAGAIYEALEAAYAMPAADRRLQSRRCRDHALCYDVRRVFDEYWIPTLAAVEQRLFGAGIVEIPARVPVAA
jgi:glycosyltransferase involved in cell wall biosynthesis